MDPTFKGLSVPTPTRAGSRGFDIRHGLLFGGVLIALITVVAVVASLLTAGPSDQLQRLLYRLDALSTLTVNARGNISGEELSKINAELSLILEGDNASVKKVITAAQMNDALTAIKTEETDAASTDKLKTAKLNADYDAAYKTILMQKVEATSALSGELLAKVSGSQLKATLTTLRSHLDAYDAELKAL